MQAVIFALPELEHEAARAGNPLRDGRVSEQLVIAKLLTLGHHVAVPVIDDDGVDLIVNYRFKVQVKSSCLRDKGDERVYRFATAPSRAGGRRDAHVDVYVLHGRDTDEWWVVSAANLQTMARFSRTPGSTLDKDAWHVFDV